MNRKSLIGFFIVFVTAIILDLIIGWLSALIAGVCAGLYFRKSSKAFWIGFLGVGTAWLLIVFGPAIWIPTVELAGKLVQVFGFSAEFFFLMFLLTALLGGIIGGLGAVNGVMVCRIISKKKSLNS